jgi:hypothetical protein
MRLNYGQIRGYGGALLVLPQEALDAMNVTDGAVKSLDADAQAASGVVGTTFMNAWAAFVSEWRAFYEDNAGWWTRFASGPAIEDAANEYRQRVIDWRTKFVAAGGTPSTPTPPKPSNPADLLGQAQPILIIGAVVMGLWAAGRIFGK